MNKPLFLFLGKSSSGKSTIADMMESKYGYNQVWSYTTRPMRTDNEKYHTFVSESDFNNLGELVAYSYYNNHHYGTTVEQLDKCDIYVVDVPGIQSLLQKYKTERPLCIIYFDAGVYTRICRMIDRHDSDAAIISRLLHDEEDDWYDQINKMVWNYANNEHRDIKLCKVDANNNKTEVLNQVLYYIKQYDNVEGD